MGKTVRIYLADKSPTGIRHAELVNWTGQAMVCPRSRIGELKEWEEAQRPGVYFLIGENPNDSRPMAYIGEAENVFDRLRHHVSTKDFWEKVIFFTSKDQNLTKSHVKYLESRLVKLAQEANRMNLGNQTQPKCPALPRPDKAAMEEFLGPMRILLGALGFTLLEPLKTQSNAAEEPGNPLANIPLFFNMVKRGVKSEGRSTDEGFVVLKGSVGTAEMRPSMEGNVGLKKMLLTDGILQKQNDTIVFTEDYLFRSPSAAASVLCGTSKNGRNQAWEDSQGRSLGQLEEELANTVTDSLEVLE